MKELSEIEESIVKITEDPKKIAKDPILKPIRDFIKGVEIYEDEDPRAFVVEEV